MSYKDTLTLYEELVATGIPDAQAKIQAHQQGNLADEIGGVKDMIKWESIFNFYLKCIIVSALIVGTIMWVDVLITAFKFYMKKYTV